MATIVSNNGHFKIAYDPLNRVNSSNKVLFSETTRTPNYIMCRFDNSVSYDTRQKASEWCRQTQCGKKVSLHQIAFKTEEEFMMFTLRWL
jgi:hypothetical protein